MKSQQEAFMNLFFKFTRHVLLVLIVGLPFLADADTDCRSPKQNPQGPGSSSTAVLASFGTWYIPSNAGIIVNDGDVIPFNTQETAIGITNSSGVFTLSKTGTYLVTVGYAPQESGDILEIEKNNTLVSGGHMEPPVNSSNVVSVMFTASAGDHIDVKNKSGFTISIGLTGIAPGIYISILQIK